ncbi:hypothetical protein MPSEU_000280000 [Mayamaea pseudoterrestris]|nr:hypothetical protein MPSEU_000280000 [Mayamaea pseudoterrestris]
MLNKNSGSAVVKQQRDRFAEANFDTAPPSMMRASSGRDAYGEGGGGSGHYSHYGDAPYGRRFSTSQTSSQDIMPPPPRRQARRGDLEETYASSKSFSGSFNLHNNSNDAWYEDNGESDELAEHAQHVASVDEDEDDGGMLAILQRQLLAKAAVEAQQRHEQQATLHAYPTMRPMDPNGQAGISMGMDAIGAMRNLHLGPPQVQPQPYFETYHAVMPSAPIASIAAQLDRMQVDAAAMQPTPLPPSFNGGAQAQTYAQPSQIQPVGSFEVPTFKSRASGRFSSIGELEDGQLETLLTGLDVSLSDLNFDDAQQQQQQQQQQHHYQQRHAQV